ncbi:MAG: YbhN family protein [Saprospiraceae bacterium]
MNKLDQYWGRIVFFISIGVIGNIYFSWQATDTDTLRELQNFSPIYLVLALGLLLLMWIFNATRLYIWGRFLKINAPFWSLFRISVATDLGSSITPTVVGGAPIKVGMLTQTGFRLGVATTMIALNGVEDVCFFLLIIPISLTLTDSWNSPILQDLYNGLQQHLPTVAIYLLVGVIAVIFIRFLFQRFSFPFFKNRKFNFLQNIRSKVSQVTEDFKAVFKLIGQRGRLTFALSVLATCGQWLSRFAILVVLVLALDIHENLLELFTLQWMVYLSMSLVPTPGATGGAEVIFYYVFKDLLPASLIGIIVASWRFLTYYFMMLLALLLLQMLGKSSAKVV